MSYDFHTTTHGKWILAGEHAALRGHGVLLFPIHHKELTLSYHPSAELNAHFSGMHSEDMHSAFWGVLEHGCRLLNTPFDKIQGQFYIQNTIPVGVGLGASAALCVAVARWFAAYAMIAETAAQSFAKQLEDLFHGQSSGADIAGVAATSGIYFKQGISSPLHVTWQPQWYLSSCKQIGKTSDCIKKVSLLREKDGALAHHLDQQMAVSVSTARAALEHTSEDALQLLTDAINNAADCFQQWGLVSESLHQHMLHLREAGALAVKPTGSGGGGFVISLWAKTPPILSIDLLALS